MELDPDTVTAHLRDHGITVHHAAVDTIRPRRVVVYLEGNLGLEHLERAAGLASAMDGVRSVSYADHTQSILLITGTPETAGGGPPPDRSQRPR
jgi:predicted glycosyltransferase